MRALNVLFRSSVALPFMAAIAAAAHDLDAGPADAPGWTFDLWIVLPLAASALLFTIGWMRLQRRSHRHVGRWRRRAWLFAGGWGVVAGALVSPLHAAGERSFTAHMLEHELLMLLGAPLLVLAEPLVVMLWALPATLRLSVAGLFANGMARRLWSRATEPFTATVLQAAALWIWHAPALFDRALQSDAWHVAQHLSFLLSALLFWSAMLHRSGAPTGALSAAGSGSQAVRSVAALCLFVTSLVSGALGGLMAMSQSPWYAGYARLGLAPFGLTPAEDQQLAGLLMWIPGGLVHAGVALALVRDVFTLNTAGRRGSDAT